MKNIWERIKKAGGRLEECARRFPFSFVALWLSTVYGIYLIIWEEEGTKLLFSLIIASLLCFLGELSYEYGIHKFDKLSPLVSVLAAAISYLLQRHFDNIYIYTALAALCISIVALIAFVLYHKKEDRPIVSHLIKSGFIVAVFTGVVFAGVSVCLAAFHFLIFHFDQVWKIYGILYLLAVGLFGVTLFLSYVPRPDEEVSIPATYRTIIHKALFFIYLILIGILYLYILKIIVTWKMPVGRLNWFGSFALLFYVFFYLSVDEKDGHYQALFKKHGAYLLIPVLAIQIFAIIIRLNAYGLTTARMMSLILIVIAVGFMAAQIFGFHVSLCFPLILLLAFVFTCTPLNIYDVPNRAQEKRLKNALTEGGALVDGVLNDTVNMEAQYLEDARSAYDYLRYSSGNKSSFFEEFSNSKIASSFDNNTYNNRITSFYYSVDLEDKTFDISAFKQMKLISQFDEDYAKEAESFFAGLDPNKREEYEKEGLEYITADGNKLIFRYISFEYDEENKEIQDLYWDAVLLSK